MCIDDENWGEDLAILKNYIHHTYKKLSHDFNNAHGEKEKQKIIAYNDSFSCINTGLFTNLYEPIYALFEKNNIPNKQPWFLGWLKESSNPKLNQFSRLPERARFFEDVTDLIYDYRLDIRPNVSHILEDEENIMRLPEQFRQLPKTTLAQNFEGAIQIAKKKVSANYKLAVPHITIIQSDF